MCATRDWRGVHHGSDDVPGVHAVAIMLKVDLPLD